MSGDSPEYLVVNELDVTRVVSRANFIPVYRYVRPKKNVPKKQKVKLLKLTCLYIKRKFNGTHKDFSINKKCGKTIFSF